jgi:flagellar hook-associated protein 3 FlgL
MNILSDSKSTQFVADLDRLDVKQTRLQREITSGYRVMLPSDGPENMVDILQLTSNVTRANSIGQSLVRIQSEVNSAEITLQVATNLVERARTIAAQNATETAANRAGAALEVRELHSQLVELTKTVSSGRFVFSGDSDSTALYDVDWTQTGGVVRHANAENTRGVQDVNGTTFSASLTANQIFDTRDGADNPDANNVFNAVWQLGRALEQDDRSAVENASSLLSSAMEHLGRQLTFYGNCQNRVSNAIDVTNRTTIQNMKNLSDLRDTDLAQAVVDLSMVKVHREAALGAQSQRPRKTLFDYLG